MKTWISSAQVLFLFILILMLLHQEVGTARILPSGGDRVVASLTFYPDRQAPTDCVLIFASGKVDLTVRHGTTYRKLDGRLDPERLDAVLSALCGSGIANDRLLPNRFFVGPSGSSWRISVQVGSKLCQLQSWHPLFEDKERLIVTQDGVLAISEKADRIARFESLAAPDYKVFLKIWDQCYEALDSVYRDITGERINRAPDRSP